MYDDVTGVSSMRSKLQLDELRERFIGKTAGAERKEERSGELNSENANQRNGISVLNPKYANMIYNLT